MPTQDFFAFCTTLKPVELKAIGALSRVEHFAPTETIYRTGEPGDRLYIVNRGVVEIVNEAGTRSGCGTYLSRGDILGEVEAFTGELRRHSARTCEAVSVQCFEAKDFPELLARVPSFFRFLCSQLAHRLEQAHAEAPAGVERLELSGSLGNFDLVTIYQTIVNSAQTGELAIRSADGELVSAFYFDAGRPRFGRFEHLTGEEAFWQLFLSEGIDGTFAFSSGVLTADERTGTAEIRRPPGEMLIHALHRRDEFHALKTQLGDSSAAIERQKPILAAEQFGNTTLQPVIEQVWRYCDKRRVPLRSLFPRFAVCELNVYKAVAVLVESGHLTIRSNSLADKVA